MKTINIVDYTEYPGLRHIKMSENSGEDFYHSVLNEEFYNAIRNDYVLTINLDDTSGFALSFLDEAFGNLIYDFGIQLVEKHLEIISTQEEHLIDFLKGETFVDWQKRREKKDSPKKTGEHTPPYWAFIDDDLRRIEER